MNLQAKSRSFFSFFSFFFGLKDHYVGVRKKPGPIGPYIANCFFTHKLTRYKARVVSVKLESKFFESSANFRLGTIASGRPGRTLAVNAGRPRARADKSIPSRIEAHWCFDHGILTLETQAPASLKLPKEPPKAPTPPQPPILLTGQPASISGQCGRGTHG